ncbi:unnamed protein product, partial [Discosporangium mesarthrocarpum]
RGERLRRREEEREAKRAARRVRMGKSAKTPGRGECHEDRGKKKAIKRRLEVARLDRLVRKQEERLRDYCLPKPKETLDPELRRKRRRCDFYDLDTSHWKLRGAARPAAFLPGAGGCELVDERDNTELGLGKDLFDKYKDGGFYEGPEACREFLDLIHQLARALHDVGQTKEALPWYERCLVLDPVDHVKARRGLVRLLLDSGDAAAARAVIDRFPEDGGCELAWSLVAVEFVSQMVLKEEGAQEEVVEAALEQAYNANPFVAWFLAHQETFDKVVEHVDEIVAPVEGSVEEGFWYMFREAGLWASLDGVGGWIGNFLLSNEILPPDPHSQWAATEKPSPKDSSDEGGYGGGEVSVGSSSSGVVTEKSDGIGDMYATMFETAVGMAAEMAAKEIGVEEEAEGCSGAKEERG